MIEGLPPPRLDTGFEVEDIRFTKIIINCHSRSNLNIITKFNNFIIKNVSCKHSGEVGIYAVGVEGNPLKNITLRNITVLSTPRDEVVAFAEGLRYFGVVINGKILAKPVNTGVMGLHTD